MPLVEITTSAFDDPDELKAWITDNVGREPYLVKAQGHTDSNRRICLFWAFFNDMEAIGMAFSPFCAAVGWSTEPPRRFQIFDLYRREADNRITHPVPK